MTHLIFGFRTIPSVHLLQHLCHNQDQEQSSNYNQDGDEKAIGCCGWVKHSISVISQSTDRAEQCNHVLDGRQMIRICCVCKPIAETMPIIRYEVNCNEFRLQLNAATPVNDCQSENYQYQHICKRIPHFHFLHCHTYPTHNARYTEDF